MKNVDSRAYRKYLKEGQSFIQEYLENCKRLNKSAETVRNYQSDLRQFLKWKAWFTERSIFLVGEEELGEYQEFLKKGLSLPKTPAPSVLKSVLSFGLAYLAHLLRERGQNAQDRKKMARYALSVSSQKRHLSSIKNFYEYLVQKHGGKRKQLEENPVKSKIHSIKLKEIDVEHTLTLFPADFTALIEESYRPLDRVMFMLLYYGGLRLEELSSLQVRSFNPDRKSVHLNRKGGYRHELFIQHFHVIWGTLYPLIQNVSQEDFLFLNKQGRKLSKRSLYTRIKKKIFQCGLNPKLGPHSFRKGCATELYRQTKDLLFVRDYLNHHDAKVTQTYIDTGPLYEEERAQLFLMASQNERLSAEDRIN